MKKFAQCGPLPPGLVPPLCNQLSEQGFTIEGTLFAGAVAGPPQKKVLSVSGNGAGQPEMIPLNYVLFAKDVEPNEELPHPEIDLPGVDIRTR